VVKKIRNDNKREINMKKRFAIILTLALGFLLSGAAGVSAEDSKKHTTPYGDFCKLHSHYGTHNKMLTSQEVEKALRHYYGEKGLDFEIVKTRGRFVEVLIKDKNTVVDKVVFDRHTGRIRSIY
jgi:hypothetical protein